MTDVASGRRARGELGRFLRAQVSSSTATAVHWVIVSLLGVLKVNYSVAVALGSLAGGLTDFNLKRRWAFERPEGQLPVQAATYAAVSLASAVLNTALATWLRGSLHIAGLPAAMIASTVLGFVWNYPMHRYVVFGRRKG